MRHSIYKITNNINGKIYIGAHSTKNVADNYMGSGTILKKAFLKYGLENFNKDTLSSFNTAEEMYKKEAEIVNNEFIKRDDTYNLKEGGFGGWNYINENKLNDTEANRTARLKNLEKANEANKKLVANGLHRKGFTISEETKAKMSQTRKGRGKGKDNPMFNKKIVNKDGVNKTIDINDVEIYLNNNWVLGQLQKKSKNITGKNNPSFGKKWYTNGKESKLSSEKDSLDLIKNGWIKGRKIKN